MLTNIQSRIDPKQKWEKLNSVGMVEYVRTINGKTTVETRYYISSLPNDAKLLGQSVRNHWGVENSLHWGGVSAGEASPRWFRGGSFPPGHTAAEPPLLDVAFGEDDCRIRKDNAPQNFAVLRHIAVNLLGREKSKKFGVKNKQFLAGMDNEYLTKILSSA